MPNKCRVHCCSESSEGCKRELNKTTSACGAVEYKIQKLSELVADISTALEDFQNYVNAQLEDVKDCLVDLQDTVDTVRYS